MNATLAKIAELRAELAHLEAHCGIIPIATPAPADSSAEIFRAQRIEQIRMMAHSQSNDADNDTELSRLGLTTWSPVIVQPKT